MTTNPTLERPQSGRVPPEEQFWQRYSPRHEAPLAGVGSLTLHGLAAGLLALAGLLAYLGMGRKEPRPDIVVYQVGDPAGDLVPGEAPAGAPAEEAGRPDPPPAAGSPARDPLREPGPAAPASAPPELGRVLQPPVKGEEVLGLLDQTNREADKRLRRPAKPQAGGGDPSAPVGRPSTGKPGGGGNGTGGPGAGGRTAGFLRPTPRSLRWTIRFNIRDANHYLDQLQKLGATLAIPAGGGRFKVVRNLAERPARPRDEDVSGIQQIFWYDSNPQPVLQALGVPLRPQVLVVFLPGPFEEELARLEREYRGLSEDEIESTEFALVPKGAGYEPRVVAQTPKAPGARPGPRP
jgi:hypothetical protein